MSTITYNEERLEELREIALDVLELDDDELTLTSNFKEEHGADSLRAIEILARVEKQYKIDIDQSELEKMVNLEAVYAIVARYAGWDQ
ncbi:MAG: acyl carrier protein [Dermatophilaceae bacterium]